MLKYGPTLLIFVAMVTLLMASCGPKPDSPRLATPTGAAPAPSLTPVATEAAPKPAAPTISPEDAAWAKIVDAAKTEGQITAYSETFQGDVGVAVSKAFKDRYGITVNIITIPSSGLYERLRTESRMGQIAGDFTETSPTVVGSMSKDGLLASTGDILPVLREKGVWLIEPAAGDTERKASLIWRVSQRFPFINTNLVKPGEAPNSWKDMLDPKWKGKMVLTDPKVDVSFYQQMVPLLDKKIWDENYLKALFKQELRFKTSSVEVFRSLASGESYLFFCGPDVGAAPFIKEGAPIQAIDIKEGLPFSGPSMGAIKGGPHPNATLLFLNWLLGPEGQNVYGKARGNRMVRTDVPNFSPQGSFAPVSNPIFGTMEQNDRANQLFKDKWINNLVGL